MCAGAVKGLRYFGVQVEGFKQRPAGRFPQVSYSCLFWVSIPQEEYMSSNGPFLLFPQPFISIVITQTHDLLSHIHTISHVLKKKGGGGSILSKTYFNTLTLPLFLSNYS